VDCQKKVAKIWNIRQKNINWNFYGEQKANRMSIVGNSKPESTTSRRYKDLPSSHPDSQNKK
jgi:hypothetical protein